MPNEVCRQIIHNHKHQAHLTDDESSDNDHEDGNLAATATMNPHLALAIHDLLTEINLDTMDSMIHETFAAAYAVPYSAHYSNVDHQPTPLSPTLTASTSSTARAPTKKKNKKKRKKSATVEEVQAVMHDLSLKEEDKAEYLM
jgi:hypothetical protein